MARRLIAKVPEFVHSFLEWKTVDSMLTLRFHEGELLAEVCATERHPTVAATTVRMLDRLRVLMRCRQGLRSHRGQCEGQHHGSPEPSEPKFGWQQKATQCFHRKFHGVEYWPGLSNPERALMLSQCGPLASATRTAVPTNRMTRIEAQPFRLLLLRRLRLPLTLSAIIEQGPGGG